jgi:hypothetical protein
MEYFQATPIITLIFGCFISYIGWTTKKILENIESTVKKTADKVEYHAGEISDIHTVLKIHDLMITNLQGEVVEIKKSAKM